MSRAKSSKQRTNAVKERADAVSKLEQILTDLPMGTDNLKDILKVFDKAIGSNKDKTVQTILGLSQLSKIPDYIYDAPCEVRPSTYGRGVFATRDISKGDFITLYPAHGIEFDRINKKKSHYIGDIEYDTEYVVDHSKNKMAFMGDKDSFNGLFMGHLINDNYPSVEDFKDKEKLAATAVNYYLHASTFANCLFKDGTNFTIIQAYKDIKKDEELFVSYGLAYWGDDDNHSDTTEKKMLGYIDSLMATNPRKGKVVLDIFSKYIELIKSVRDM
jgi:SET domain-containing protein